jgi:hypothetical protein
MLSKDAAFHSHLIILETVLSAGYFCGSTSVFVRFLCSTPFFTFKSNLPQAASSGFNNFGVFTED